MINEKNAIKCESVFNEDKTHRYLWKRVWDKDKPTATIVMLNPCQADNIITDLTSMLVVNNIAKLGEYGGVNVVNLFSMLTTKLNFRTKSDKELNTPENDSYIKKAAEESSIIVIAWGRSEDSNTKVAERAEKVFELLASFKDKLKVISDGENKGMHPLSPSVRSSWILEDFDRLSAKKEKAPSK